MRENIVIVIFLLLAVSFGVTATIIQKERVVTGLVEASNAIVNTIQGDGSISVSDNRLTDVKDPQNSQGVVTKGYVDQVADDIKQCPSYIDEDNICKGTTICGVHGTVDCPETIHSPTISTVANYKEDPFGWGSCKEGWAYLCGENANENVDAFCEEEGYSGAIEYETREVSYNYCLTYTGSSCGGDGWALRQYHYPGYYDGDYTGPSFPIIDSVTCN